MRRVLPSLALSGLVALGFALAAPSAEAAALSAGGAAANLVKTVAAAQETPAIKVHDRRHYHHRHHYHRYHYHRRPHGGFYFQFGSGGYYYGPPRVYVQPHVYIGPRYRRPDYRLSAAHVRWCYDRYRSYRAYDNTFQPYHGPRRPCISPYMR